MSSAQEHPFESILFPSSDIAGRAQSEDTLHDLALDQVFARIDEDAPRAGSAFRALPPTVDAVEYRQAVFRCLEQPAMRAAVETFLAAMNDFDRCDHAASKSSYPYEGELWHLRAMVTYVAAVEGFHSALTAALAGALTGDDESSEAWTGLESHLGDYRSSLTFTDMSSDARGVRQRFAELRYNALLRGLKVTIAVTDGEDDLGKQVRSTFERFRQGEVSDHRTSFREADMDHIQGWMLERAAEVHPGPFADLIDFARSTTQYRDPVLVRFTDEVRFYLAYLDHIAPMRAAGLPMCCPQVSAGSTSADRLRAGLGGLHDPARLRYLGHRPRVPPRRRRGDCCDERPRVGRRRADSRDLRPQPGREDDHGPDVRPAPPSGGHRVPGARREREYRPQ